LKCEFHVVRPVEIGQWPQFRLPESKGQQALACRVEHCVRAPVHPGEEFAPWLTHADQHIAAVKGGLEYDIMVGKQHTCLDKVIPPLRGTVRADDDPDPMALLCVHQGRMHAMTEITFRLHVQVGTPSAREVQRGRIGHTVDPQHDVGAAGVRSFQGAFRQVGLKRRGALGPQPRDQTRFDGPGHRSPCEHRDLQLRHQRTSR
jgi:hypothetical protein